MAEKSEGERLFEIAHGIEYGCRTGGFLLTSKDAEFLLELRARLTSEVSVEEVIELARKKYPEAQEIEVGLGEVHWSSDENTIGHYGGVRINLWWFDAESKMHQFLESSDHGLSELAAQLRDPAGA